MSLPPPITSRTNARVKALRAAFGGKASRAGEVVGLSGQTLVDEALRSGLRLETLFVREDVAESAWQAWRDQAAEEVMVLGSEVFASVVDTVTPQPMGATVRIPAEGACLQENPGGTLLVFEDLQDPGNVGTLIRSAEAFGAAGVYLTPGCANPWGPKVLRASAGSVFRMPMHRAEMASMLGSLRRAEVRVVGTVAEAAGARPPAATDLRGNVAIVIGNEGRGLSREALCGSDELVHIPCETESLNAAIAGSILLYEAQRQNRESPRGGDARFKVAAL